VNFFDGTVFGTVRRAARDDKKHETPP